VYCGRNTGTTKQIKLVLTHFEQFLLHLMK